MIKSLIKTAIPCALIAICVVLICAYPAYADEPKSHSLIGTTLDETVPVQIEHIGFGNPKATDTTFLKREDLTWGDISDSNSQLNKNWINKHIQTMDGWTCYDWSIWRFRDDPVMLTYYYTYNGNPNQDEVKQAIDFQIEADMQIEDALEEDAASTDNPTENETNNISDQADDVSVRIPDDVKDEDLPNQPIKDIPAPVIPKENQQETPSSIASNNDATTNPTSEENKKTRSTKSSSSSASSSTGQSNQSSASSSSASKSEQTTDMLPTYLVGGGISIVMTIAIIVTLILLRKKKPEKPE